MTRAFQWDLARQVERLDVLLKLLPQYADWGYQELYLHLEDAVEFPGLPTVARSDAYSYREFTRLVTAATKVGIKVVPIVNLLGHTQYLIKVPELRDLNELRGEDGSPLERGQLCPLHSRTLEVADRLIADMAPFCTSGKVHVGLDESFALGQCPRCREEIERIGLGGHFAAHVQRLHKLTTARQLRLGMWADMLNYVPDAIPHLPREIVAYDWYYYPFRRHPKVELYNFAELDLATPLRARGIEYWGCPMNGAFRFEPLPFFADRLGNARSWWHRCKQVGAAGFLMTSWEAYRLALEMPTAVDAAVADFWLSPQGSEQSDLTLLKKGFSRLYGTADSTSQARNALACDRYPYSGYYRWRVNERWDTSASGLELSVRKKEARWYQRLRRNVSNSPTALSASVAFRRYLAERDFFICEGQQAVYQLRQLVLKGQIAKAQKVVSAGKLSCRKFMRALTEGRRAAVLMWRRSRNPRIQGQNIVILDQDSQRLQQWSNWLNTISKDFSSALADTPLCGAWQLEFEVVNFAPALQKIVVEQKNTSDVWEVVHGLHLIEFTSAAAQSRAEISRPWSVPVRRTTNKIELRVGLRGIGQARVRNCTLFNGVERVKLVSNPPHTLLGKKAPRHGFPMPDWEKNVDEVYLTLPDSRKKKTSTAAAEVL